MGKSGGRDSFIRNEVAWQIAIQYAIKRCQAQIVDLAAGAIVFPENHKTYRDVYWLLRRIETFVQSKPSDGPGHYMNKAAVVYLMSLVEYFVQGVHEELCDGAKFSRTPFGKRLCDIGKELSDFYEAEPVKRIRLLTELRNQVVHNRGMVTEEFLKRTEGLAACWPEVAEEFKCLFREGRQVCLDISKVVLPGLKYALDFVDYTMGRVAERKK